jgi:hypothetical protein
VSLRGATLDRAASWFGDLATLERTPEAAADLSVILLPPDSRDEAPTGGEPDSGLEFAMRQFAVRRLPAAAAWQLRASQCGLRTDLVVEEHGGLTDQLLAAVAPALLRRVRSHPA